MKRIKKYLGGSYFRLPSLSSEFQTGASYVTNVPYINTLLQQYITNTGNFSAPIPTSSKVKDNTLKDTISNIGSSIIGKASDAVSDKIFGDSELGRNLGTIFSSGLNSVGDTVLNNAIKKAALTDGLTKNLGSSVGGAVAGLGANYLGRGITSILGNNAASRFLGLSASTVGGTIGGKILSSGTKNLFSGPGSINPIGLGMSAVGAGLSAATGPSKEYNGTYGSTTKALDTVYDALLAGINFVPGWGLIASGAMALNKGLSNIFGSTDGMTTLDAILGSAFMPAPIKWLNMLGSSKTGTFNKLSWQNTLKTSNFMQNAFGDLEDKFSKAREEAGKTYGTFSQGAKKRALNNIDFSNFAWNKILNMADLNEYQNIRSSDMASINNLRYALWILGGFSPLARGKKGMKIFNNSTNHNLGLRLLSGAALIDSKQMILSALNGTKIKKKGIKSGINVDYYDPDNVMSVVANNPDKTIVLDELTVRPYNKLPMQSELFQGMTNQTANEKADEHVNRVTPTAEDLFNIGTLGGLNNLSPTQWARRAYDLREAIKGNMLWNKFGNNWFYGNNGLVSDKYAQEHPYASAAINLTGDIGAFGTFSALRKLPKYATLMKAEANNIDAQIANAVKLRDMLSNNIKRTRVGDVEIDNPGLAYRQGDASMGADFLNTGIVSIKNGSYDNPMFAQGKLFYGSPFETPSLLNPSLGATKGTRSGRVFLLRKPKDMTAKSDLLVSDVDMANANKDSHIISPYARELDENGNVIVTKVNEDIRRVPFAEKPATSKNTTLYRWKPNYGYKKVSVPKSTYVVGKEIVDDAGNLNINVDDLLKQIKTEYPYTLNPEDLINKGTNGSTDLSEHLQAVVKSAQTYPLPKGVSRKEFVTTALYHDLGKVFGDFGHGTNSAVIASELNLPITRNAIKAVSSHMNQQKYFETATQLEKALHAADVGRGMKYEALIKKYPYLKYDTPQITVENATNYPSIMADAEDYSLKGGSDLFTRRLYNMKIHGQDLKDFSGKTFSSDVKKGISNKTKEEIRNNVVRRNMREFMNDGLTSSEVAPYATKVEKLMNDINVGRYSQRDYEKAGWDGFGGFYDPERNFISINREAAEKGLSVEPHEVRHAIDHNIDDEILTPTSEIFGKDFDSDRVLSSMQRTKQKQNMILQDAYDNDFIDIPNKPGYNEGLENYPNLEREAITTNRDAREALLGSKKDWEPDITDKIIDKMPDTAIFEAVEKANGYGRRFIKFLRENNKLSPKKAQQFREAMKHVGVYAAPVGVTLGSAATLYNKSK